MRVGGDGTGEAPPTLKQRFLRAWGVGWIPRLHPLPSIALFQVTA